MNVARTLRYSRRRAGLTQRALAVRSGVAQPTIARIEGGVEIPRLDTLDRLLDSCGDTLEVVPRAGVGVDRTAIRSLLALTPAQRASSLVGEAELMDRIAAARQLT